MPDADDNNDMNNTKEQQKQQQKQHEKGKENEDGDVEASIKDEMKKLTVDDGNGNNKSFKDIKENNRTKNGVIPKTLLDVDKQQRQYHQIKMNHKKPYTEQKHLQFELDQMTELCMRTQELCMNLMDQFRKICYGF